MCVKYIFKVLIKNTANFIQKLTYEIPKDMDPI